jgi:hypothetical protein
MDIKRAGSQPSAKAPTEHFTGTVRVDPLFDGDDPARATGSSVTFEPCARTAWQTDPLGQTLIVTSGCGRVQRWGGPIEEVRPGGRDAYGDVVQLRFGGIEQCLTFARSAPTRGFRHYDQAFSRISWVGDFGQVAFFKKRKR